MSSLSTLTLAAVLAMPVALQTPATPAQDAKKQDSPKATMSASDFIMKAADAGMKEVDISKMAIEKTKNEDVKGFARRLVTDHSSANDDLLRFSKSRKVTLKADPTIAMKVDPTANPSRPPTMPPVDHHAAHASLMVLEGAAFDKAYIDQMVKDHQQAVELFDVQSDDGMDSEIKDWANKKLPTLREHLKMAKDLQDKIGK